MIGSTPSLILSLAAVLSLAACGGKGGAAAKPAATPAAGGPPYAGIFVDREATYRQVSRSSMYDPDDPKADASGQVVDESTSEVRCRTATRAVHGWQVAEITCEGDGGGGVLDDLETLWLAGPAGLYRLDAGETLDSIDLAALGKQPPLLAAKPVPVEEKEGDESEQFGRIHAVRGGPAGWCIEDGSWGGDESGGSTCIEAARGIVSITRYWAGGSTRDESLELVE